MTAFIKKWHIILLSLACFLIFKIFFPNPNLFLDSLGYLAWGLDDYAIAYRPMGYTRFLMLFRDLPSNYINIVVVQYILLVFCSWYFNQTIFKVFKIAPKFQWIFWALTLFNPISFFLVNFISPDTLFINLSALWMATLLRFIFYKERRYLNLAIHIVSFIFLFNLRYNALYYPLISVVIILCCTLKLPVKAIFAGLSLAVFGILYNNTVTNAEENTGVKILSGFSGWLMANNALHIQNVAVVDSNIFEDPEQQMVNRFVVHFRDSIKQDPSGLTDQYMWGRSGPLKQYLSYCLQTGRYPDYITGWWNVSVPFNDYATTLIKHYPGAFFKAFYLPNLLRYPMPPAEVLDKFDPYNASLSPQYQQYFGYNSAYFTAMYPMSEHYIVIAVTYLYALLGPLGILAALVSIFLFIRQFIKQKFRNPDPLQLTAFIFSSFYLISLALLTFAAPILLRYVALLLIYFSTLPLLVAAAHSPKARKLLLKDALPED